MSNNVSCLLPNDSIDNIIKTVYGVKITKKQLEIYRNRHNAVTDIFTRMMDNPSMRIDTRGYNKDVLSAVLRGDITLDNIGDSLKTQFLERYKDIVDAMGNKDYFKNMPITTIDSDIFYYSDIVVSLEDYDSRETAQQALRILTGLAIKYGNKEPTLSETDKAKLAKGEFVVKPTSKVGAGIETDETSDTESTDSSNVDNYRLKIRDLVRQLTHVLYQHSLK